MKSKNGASILFGIIFILLGIFMLIIRNGATLVLVIAIADILFGIVLIASLLFGKKGVEAYEPYDAYDAEPDDLADNVASSRRAQPAASFNDAADDGFHDDFDDEPDPINMAAPADDQPVDEDELLRRLTAREFELKTAARRASDDAKTAKQQADSASAAAKAAEDKLIEAEQRARNLVGAEQQAALKRVDQLANEARELSQEAVIAKKKARAAVQAAKQATDAHSKAMDAAAEAMMAAEERAFSQTAQ